MIPADPRSDPDFRLSDAERARLRLGIDVGALEQLLAMLPVGARDIVLNALAAKPSFRAFDAAIQAWTAEQGIRGGRAMLIPPDLVFHDPNLQRLLEQVVAPLTSADPIRREEHEWYERFERPARETPVLLVIPPSWHDDDALAMVVRRIDASPPDIILVDASRADAMVLDAALETLVRERVGGGVTPREPRTIALGATTGSRSLPIAWQDYLTTLIQRLLGEPERVIEAVGLSRAIEFRIAS